MSKQASPTLIGGFVVGAIAVLVAGLLIFGGTNLFAERQTYVAYFDESVKGLRPGAAVDFRGAQVGQVTGISVRYDQSNESLRIPVVIELQGDRITFVDGATRPQAGSGLRPLIEKGLRAQLQMESLVTGLLYINLDFFPNTEVKVTGGEQPYPEMPTIPSPMATLQMSGTEVLTQVPEIARKLDEVLAQLSQGLGASQGGIEQIVKDVAAFTDGLEKAAPAIDRLVANADQTTTDVKELVQANREAIGSAIVDLRQAAAAMTRMADQVNNLVAENREGLRDFTSNGLYQFSGLAVDAQDMVNQIRRIAEELERDPTRFLFGNRAGGVSPNQ